MLPINARIISGDIELESINVISLEKEALRRYRWEKVSMVFQSAMNALDPVKTIESQIAETIRQHKKVSPGEARTKARQLLELVNIDIPQERGPIHIS